MKAYNTPKDELHIESDTGETLVSITPEKTTIANLEGGGDPGYTIAKVLLAPEQSSTKEGSQAKGSGSTYPIQNTTNAWASLIASWSNLEDDTPLTLDNPIIVFVNGVLSPATEVEKSNGIISINYPNFTLCYAISEQKTYLVTVYPYDDTITVKVEQHAVTVTSDFIEVVSYVLSLLG